MPIDPEVEQLLEEQAKAKEEPENLITNYFEDTIPGKNGPKKIKIPRMMPEIIAEIKRRTGDWPRCVDSILFVDDPYGGLAYFDRRTQSSLFGWLRQYNRVKWSEAGDFVSKGELFAELERIAEKYEAVERIPHEPKVPNVYYACEDAVPGDGKHFRELINRFRPDTTADRELIKAAFLTAFWGGDPGKRPLFVITSDDGVGVGKSTVVEMLGRLCGGHIAVSPNDDMAKVKTRLLTPSVRDLRICLMDNVKSLKLSWAELESLITETVISGRQLYTGEGRRPNLMTWFMTLNGVSLSTDLAARSIIVKVTRGDNDGKWHENTVKYINEHRQAIIGDIIGLLRSEPVVPEGFKFSRWATWEQHVLCKLADPAEVQREYLERQAESDAEFDEVNAVLEFFENELHRYEFNPKTSKVRLPSRIVALWYNEATNSRAKTEVAVRRVHQLCKERRLGPLSVDPSRKHGRCFVWDGGDVPNGTPTSNDLLDRLRTVS